MYENCKFYICEKILDESFTKTSKDICHFTVKDEKRLFIPGMSVKQYIQNKSYEEKKEILILLIEYIYKNFSVANGKIDGIVYDCALYNFIIDDNLNFHFIDNDFVLDIPVDKKHIVTYTLKDIDDYYLCKEIFEHFGCINLPELETKNKYEPNNKYIELKNRYFT